MQDRVGVAIVNYNAGDDLPACVASLKAEGLNDIVVVDNGSTDGSFEALIEQFPDVQVTRLANPGYGFAMNHGAAMLANESVFLLNPDTTVHAGAIDALQAGLDSDPRIAVAGPRIENSDGSLYPSARRFPSLIDGCGHALFGMFKPDNRWSRRYKMLDWNHESAQEVDWLSGAAMFVRKSAFDEVGGFDPGYRLYMEEVDLCRRLHVAGWKSVYEPAAVITHVGGTATNDGNRRFKSVMSHHRSVLRYLWKTERGLGRLVFPMLVVGTALRLAVRVVQTAAAPLRKVSREMTEFSHSKA